MNYIEHLLILTSTVTVISPFASLAGVPLRIKNYVVSLKICRITAGIKNYNSMIKKNRKKHDEILFSKN